MRALTASDPSISVCAAGITRRAENVLVHNATGRVVPRGKRQTDVGVMLFNVTTMSEIGHFVRTGMPLIARRVTVTGDAIAHPGRRQVVSIRHVHRDFLSSSTAAWRRSPTRWWSAAP